MSDVETLASQIVEGSTRALGRGLTWVESGGKRAEALSAQLYPHTGRAQIVGVTGAPGSGKSTLVRSLALVARARGRTVGVVAVLGRRDPQRPDPHERPGPRSRRLHPLDGDARRAGRSVSRRGGRRRPHGRRRTKPRLRRDRRRRAGRGGRNASGSDGPRRLGAWSR